MDYYRRSYHTLFNAITDALRAMDAQNFGLARDMLIRSQQLCEERYMEEGSEEDSSDPSLFYFFRPSNTGCAVRLFGLFRRARRIFIKISHTVQQTQPRKR